MGGFIYIDVSMHVAHNRLEIDYLHTKVDMWICLLAGTVREREIEPKKRSFGCRRRHR